MTGTGIAASAMDVSSDSNRMVVLEVTGGSNQTMLRSSTYSMTVPCSRLSKTIQSISRKGGKITKVSMQSASGSSPQGTVAQAPVAEPTITAVAEPAPVAQIAVDVEPASVVQSTIAAEPSAAEPVASGRSTTKNGFDPKTPARQKSKRKR